ncbi:hypothetical protein KQH65_12165, partial [archaeon]|nr:hypothetical protein [archaeon]
MTLTEYADALARYRIDEAATDPTVLETHIPLLRQLDMVDKSSVALFDMSVLRYRFLTESFKFLLGYDTNAALERGPDYFFHLMNQHDLATFLDTSISSMEYLYSRPTHERK